MSNLQLTQERLDALRSEYKPRRPCAMLKYPRPKTKPEYQSIYPWIILDETDPHFVFCAVCECRLSAKRSDLGKHEGSIKHSENAQRKSVKSKTQSQSNGSIKWEYNDESNDESLLPMQFATGSVLCKTEPDNEDEEADGEEEGEEEDEDDDGTAENEEAQPEASGDGDAEYEPASKRRASETDSQHSGLLDYLPLQVTINEMPHGQLMPAAQPATTTPQPCRITIKKVPASALTKMSTSTPTGNHEITSKATITPIASGCYNSLRQPQLQSYASRQMQSYQLQHLTSIESPPRDSLDLFFDSICSTVKGLPPKLATEGKIRVMQLIGELELRALNERDAVPAGSTVDQAATGALATPSLDAPGGSQQNATVASTTK
ncbi:hypothetical protein AWZ03_005145 [Drosophila navojoa]|uniref:BESS domain-containing protein n=1 Tax=Drosophila navojoa TaxID=7232 RepID=A0A484BK30_DRONA|nr:uncharacterized protein LOC108659489 [Drosophila navojoa]TDG48400.1 hypothetical protein AWZ03_005145 [Drosophila navojoa]